MRLSIRVDDPLCPAGAPVSLVDLDSGEMVACHSSVVDAQRHKSLIESARSFDDDDDGDDDDGDAWRRGYNAGMQHGYRACAADINRLMARSRSADDDDDEPDDDSDLTEPDDDDDEDIDGIGEGDSGIGSPLLYSTPAAARVR